VRKPAREVKIESVEDFEALPEGEWVCVPGGFRIPIVFDNLITIDGVEYVPLPPTLLARVKAAMVERFRARRSRRLPKRAA
jgi:hypothetical protein